MKLLKKKKVLIKDNTFVQKKVEDMLIKTEDNEKEI